MVSVSARLGLVRGDLDFFSFRWTTRLDSGLVCAGLVWTPFEEMALDKLGVVWNGSALRMARFEWPGFDRG